VISYAVILKYFLGIPYNQYFSIYLIDFLMAKKFLYFFIFLVYTFEANAQASFGFYGMTYGGGPSYYGNEGNLFKVDSTGANPVAIPIFTISYEGTNLESTLCEAANGKFYGMSSSGGANDLGVIFEYDTLIGYTKKFDFTAMSGQQPYGSLIKASK
jgi:uncharacterized repeat protein (TIGR03803 family)